MSIEYSTRLLDHVRETIGDEGNEMITDEKINSFITCRSQVGKRTTATMNFFNVDQEDPLVARNSSPTPVSNILVDLPVDADRVYRIDETNKEVIYLSGGTSPTEGEQIKISYTEVRFSMLMADVFEFLSNKTVKMEQEQSISGININTKGLSDQFYKQAVRWSVKEQW